MVAIEHGHLPERQALVAGLEDLLADERGLLVGILRWRRPAGGTPSGRAETRSLGNPVCCGRSRPW